MFKKLFIAVFMLAFLISAAGCNTIHGMGKDIENLGESIQKTSK